MIRRAFLHIGLEKTGTTSIQLTLRDNAARLEANGVLFDQHFTAKVRKSVGNSMGLVGAALEADKRQMFLRGRDDAWDMPCDFASYPADQIRARKDISTLIFSSEQLSSWLVMPKEVKRLREFLLSVAETVTVVVYLRRQDRLAQSLINETVKGGGVFNYRRIDRLLNLDGRKLHFVEMLRVYRDVFGANNVVLRHFARDALTDGDVVTDFQHLVGLGGMSLERPERRNASLSLEALYVMSLVNDLQAVFGDLDGLQAARKAIVRSGQGKLQVITRKRAKRLVEDFAEENAELADMAGVAKFFDGDFDEFPQVRPDIDAARVRELARLPAVARVLRQSLH